MSLVAQIADMEISGIVFYVGLLALLSPLIGLLINWAVYRSQFQAKLWKYVLAFYGLGGIALLLVPDSPLFFIGLLGMCAAGPVLGLVLLIYDNNIT